MVAGCRVARYSERVQDRGRFMKALEDSLARLRTTAEFWQSHIRDVLARPEWRGSCYAASARSAKLSSQHPRRPLPFAGRSPG